MRLTIVCTNEFHQELREQYARMKRLRKQKKSLKERDSEMLRRGIQSLDKLNALNNSNSKKLNQEIIVSFSIEDLFQKVFLRF
jgi:hypothetical protein